MRALENRDGPAENGGGPSWYGLLSETSTIVENTNNGVGYDRQMLNSESTLSERSALVFL